jgi:dihydrofolate reductase
MSKVTCNLSVSADGFSAGHNQTEERPFGDDDGGGWGNRLHAWMFDNAEENRTEVDQTTDARAYIMGRNMFGPVRGEWDRQWNGGGVTICRSTPPAFVLAHHPRPVADGRRHHVPLRHRRSRVGTGPGARGGRRRDVSIHGGASTINQHLAAGLIDELRLHIVPLTLGAGTRLFDGVPPLNLEQVDSRATGSITHVTSRVLS